MKLSEAIRKGSDGRIQAIGVLMNTMGEVCALGAAVLGAFPHLNHLGSSLSLEQQYWLADLREQMDDFEGCPDDTDCGLWSGDVGEMIEHLNDYHRWTFEEIAAWAQSKEPAE